MHNLIEELRNILNNNDPKVLSLLDELETQAYSLLYQQMREREQDAKARLQDAMAMHDDDPTGQDLDDCPRVASAVQDYLDSQDQRIKETDPYRYSEMRAMGLL